MKCKHEWIWNKGTEVYYCHLCNSTIKNIPEEERQISVDGIKVIQVS